MVLFIRKSDLCLIYPFLVHILSVINKMNRFFLIGFVAIFFCKQELTIPWMNSDTDLNIGNKNVNDNGFWKMNNHITSKKYGNKATIMITETHFERISFPRVYKGGFGFAKMYTGSTTCLKKHCGSIKCFPKTTKFICQESVCQFVVWMIKDLFITRESPTKPEIWNLARQILIQHASIILPRALVRWKISPAT